MSMWTVPHVFSRSRSSYSAQLNTLILRLTSPLVAAPVPCVSVPPVVAAVVAPEVPPEELLFLSLLPQAANHRAIALAPPAARKRRRLMLAARRSAVARGRRIRGASSRSIDVGLLV